jgi:hypothetical protein
MGVWFGGLTERHPHRSGNARSSLCCRYHSARSVPPHQSDCVGPCCLRPVTGVRPLEFGFSAITHAFTFVTARGLAHYPKEGFVNRRHSLRFLHECDPSYRDLAFPLVELFSLNTSSVSGLTITEPTVTVTVKMGLPILFPDQLQGHMLVALQLVLGVGKIGNRVRRSPHGSTTFNGST